MAITQRPDNCPERKWFNNVCDKDIKDVNEPAPEPNESCKICTDTGCDLHPNFDLKADFEKFKKEAYYHQTLFGDDVPEYATLKPGTKEHKEYWDNEEAKNGN